MHTLRCAIVSCTYDISVSGHGSGAQDNSGQNGELVAEKANITLLPEFVGRKPRKTAGTDALHFNSTLLHCLAKNISMIQKMSDKTVVIKRQLFAYHFSLVFLSYRVIVIVLILSKLFVLSL